jgi:hypothetical protein
MDAHMPPTIAAMWASSGQAMYSEFHGLPSRTGISALTLLGIETPPERGGELRLSLS